jgi:hypothetical protein
MGLTKTENFNRYTPIFFKHTSKFSKLSVTLSTFIFYPLYYSSALIIVNLEFVIKIGLFTFTMPNHKGTGPSAQHNLSIQLQKEIFLMKQKKLFNQNYVLSLSPLSIWYSVLFKFSSSLVTDAGTDFFSLIENTSIVSK